MERKAIPTDINSITFPCDGKCRICPYPGANCLTSAAKQTVPRRAEASQDAWMDPEVLAEIKRKLRLP